MRHDAHGYWLHEAPRSEPLPRAAGAIECDVLVVGGGYTGMWTAWSIAELEPEATGRRARGRPLRPRPERAKRRLRERDVVPHGRDARPLRRRGGAGDGPRVERGGARDRALLRRAGGGRLVSALRLPAGLRLARPGRGLGRRRRRLPRARRAGRGGGAQPVRARRALPVAPLPGRRLLSGRRDGSPRAPRARASRPARGARERQRLRGIATALPPCGALGMRGRDPGRAGARPLVRARDGLGERGGRLAAPRPADGDLQPHGHHRARARRARGMRLDRGRVHHRRPRDAPLLPHHPRRPHRLRLGRRAHRLRRPPRRPHRVRPGPRRPDRAGPALLLSRPRRAGGSSTAGEARSTSRPRTSPSPRGWAPTTSGRHSATRATASAPRGWWAACSPRSPSTAATSTPASPSSSPPRDRVPGGLPGWVGGNAIRAGLLAKEGAEEEDRVAHPIHRGLASIPERIGFHIGR